MSLRSNSPSGTDAGPAALLRSLDELRSRLGTRVSRPLNREVELLAGLAELAKRLEDGRFQLAVVGQFKRGKSSLINSLLGADVMPTGVVPITALATFVEAGAAYSASIQFRSRPTTHRREDDAAALRETLRTYVTEAGNPKNMLGVVRVGITVPSALLAAGIVLIDTPGVGSTFEHNSVAAAAILPECDAALFVVSPDPPITHVELDYLAQVRTHVARVIIVLNKIDLVDGADRDETVQFLRQTLSDASLEEAEIWCVSARTALQSPCADQAIARSDVGLDGLKRRLLAFFAHEKSATLERAVRSKAARLINQMRSTNTLALRALELPLDDLQARADRCDALIKRIDSERRAAADLFAADRARALAEIESRATRVRDAEETATATRVDELVAFGLSPNDAWRTVADALPQRFAAIFSAEVDAARSRLRDTVDLHRARGDSLKERIRQIVSGVMEIELPAFDTIEAFEARLDPGWTTRPRESFHALTVGALDWLLPGAHRRSVERGRVSRQIKEVVGRNVENLRWSLHQSLVEAFRATIRQFDESYEQSLSATRGLIATIIERRRASAESTHAEIAQRRDADIMLAKAHTMLAD